MIVLPGLRCFSAAFVRKNIAKMLVRKVRSNCSALICSVLLRRVVDEDVEFPQLGDRSLDRLLAKRLLADIAGDQQAASPLGLDQALRLLGVAVLVQVDDRAVGTFLGVQN